MVVFLVTLNLCYGSMMWVEIEEDDGQGKWLRWILLWRFLLDINYATCETRY